MGMPGTSTKAKPPSLSEVIPKTKRRRYLLQDNRRRLRESSAGVRLVLTPPTRPATCLLPPATGLRAARPGPHGRLIHRGGRGTIFRPAGGNRCRRGGLVRGSEAPDSSSMPRPMRSTPPQPCAGLGERRGEIFLEPCRAPRKLSSAGFPIRCRRCVGYCLSS